MKIYIASSWKNQHGVELLTMALRKQGHEVISWIENNFGENPDRATLDGKKFDFEEWVNGPQSDESFDFDTRGAMECDLFIYYGNAGKDAAAECGMCYGQRLAGKTIVMLALASKNEDFGLMRKMFDGWFARIPDLMAAVAYWNSTSLHGSNGENPHACFGRRPHPMDFDDQEEFKLRLGQWQNWEEKHRKAAEPCQE